MICPICSISICTSTSLSFEEEDWDQALAVTLGLKQQPEIKTEDDGSSCLDPIWTARCEAAPREILIQHRLLGQMKKTLKAKTHEQVMEARENWAK